VPSRTHIVYIYVNIVRDTSQYDTIRLWREYSRRHIIGTSSFKVISELFISVLRYDTIWLWKGSRSRRHSEWVRRCTVNEGTAVYMYILYIFRDTSQYDTIRLWREYLRRHIRRLDLQVIFNKRATNYRTLMWNITSQVLREGTSSALPHSKWFVHCLWVTCELSMSDLRYVTTRLWRGYDNREGILNESEKALE